MTEQALATTGTHKQSIREYMRQDEVVTRFSEILGTRDGSAYISSVLIAVAQSDKLQQCAYPSIVSSALRAAALRLSCDPATGQAHLVPYGSKATLIVGYKGLYHMALRTGKYRYINAFEILKGENVVEDRMTGIHTIEGAPDGSKEVIGIMVYIEMLNGFKKTVYMTLEEIAAHGQKYSKSYTYNDSVWKTNRRAMEKKTVLRLALSKWGYIDPNDSMYLNTSDDEAVEGVVSELPEELAEVPNKKVDVNQTMKDMGYGTDDNWNEETFAAGEDTPNIPAELEIPWNMTNKNGVKFGELSDDDIQKGINVYSDLGNKITEDGSAKLAALRQIKAYRASLTQN